jgi:hypothetical protein
MAGITFEGQTSVDLGSTVYIVDGFNYHRAVNREYSYILRAEIDAVTDIYVDPSVPEPDQKTIWTNRYNPDSIWFRQFGKDVKKVWPEYEKVNTEGLKLVNRMPFVVAHDANSYLFMGIEAFTDLNEALKICSPTSKRNIFRKIKGIYPRFYHDYLSKNIIVRKN